MRADVSVMLVALCALASTTGCWAESGPPYDCAWHGTAEGITADDLVGAYQGSFDPGQTLTLGADRSFTTTGFGFRDWYNGGLLSFEGRDGTWKVGVIEGTDVPFVDVPFVHTEDKLDEVLLDDGPGTRSLDLDIGGTREHPVLYYDFAFETDTCDSYRAMFRQV